MKRSPLRRRRPLRAVPRPAMDPALTDRIWARAADRCETFPVTGCTSRPSDLHHRLRRSQGGEDSETNLVAICAACHARIHAEPSWAFSHGLLLHRWTRP